MKEISAGGVIMYKGSTLLLRSFRGDWVLPKGRVEEGETLQETALREVKEESGLDCEIIKYIGFVRYNFRLHNKEIVHKKVHYYSMRWTGGMPLPQQEEGFCISTFVPWEKAESLLRHDSERSMVRSAFKKER